MNGFPETQTTAGSPEDEYHVLVVAEKYQTGFDQPCCTRCTWTRRWRAGQAVQTLSRLNRTRDGKDGTFVLDFRNDTDDIRASFAPWYTSTAAPPTDPNLLYDTRHALDPYGVLWPDEVERAVALLLERDTAGSHGRVHAALTPAIDRFHELGADEQDVFRDCLNRFVRTYSFLSQVVSFTDVKLEADYLFCRALEVFIRPAADTGLDLGSDIELTHLRNEEISSGSIALDPATHGEVSTIFSGAGRSTSRPRNPSRRSSRC